MGKAARATGFKASQNNQNKSRKKTQHKKDRVSRKQSKLPLLWALLLAAAGLIVFVVPAVLRNDHSVHLTQSDSKFNEGSSFNQFSTGSEKHSRFQSVWGTLKEVLAPRKHALFVPVSVNGVQCDCHVEIERSTKNAKKMSIGDGSVDGEMSEPELVVLLHGITSSSVVMRGVASHLRDNGNYVTVNFDFFGRGHSASCVHEPHSHRFFSEQIHGLLDALLAKGLITTRQREKHHVVALSMGGAVASVYGADHPTNVQSLFLFAPAGLPFPAPAIGNFLLLPGIRALLENTHWGQYLLDGRVVRALPAIGYDAEHLLLQWVNYQHALKEGFWPAIQSTVEHFPLQNTTEFYSRFAAARIPTKMFWGDNDLTVPLSCLDHGKRLIPHLEAEIVPGAGHMALMEREDVSLPSVIDFLQRHPIQPTA